MRILYVEDDPRDVEITLRELGRSAPHIHIDAVGSCQEAITTLERTPGYDAVLADMRLPDGNGLDVLSYVRTRGLPLAVVVVTGHGDEETAAAALKAGADDYAAKRPDLLAHLPLTLQNSVMRFRAESQRRARPLRVLYAEHNASDVDLTRRHMERHAPHIRIDVIFSAAEVLQRLPSRAPVDAYDVLLLDYQLLGLNALEVLKELHEERNLDVPVVLVTGRGDEEIAVQALRLGAADYLPKNPGYLFQLPGVLEDAFHRAELDRQRVALQESEARYRTLVETSPDAIVLTEPGSGRVLMANQGAAVLAGVESAAELTGRSLLDLIAEEDRTRARESTQNAVESGVIRNEQFTALRKDGSRVPVEYNSSTIFDAQGRPQAFVGVIRDISKRKQVEAQLSQAQKMEAVGRLTAGIAHDFNNLLTAINGFAELVQLRLTPGDPLWEMVGKILHSGRRAADLVGQLMAFSRQEHVHPRVLNLNVVVSDMEKMLCRIIGEDIQLKTYLDRHLWPVKADPTQVEQVLANLVINARDAMPDGGQLTIETANVTLGKRQAPPGMSPGDYVLVTVRDTGTGMTEDVKARIFEPFFTTKEKGKGTGLGLATVYGIVSGNGGYVHVDSETGKGTTFYVYLPRTLEETRATGTTFLDVPPPAGRETILLVEDDESVRGLTQFILSGQGYTVLTASTGDEALTEAVQHAAPIDLLVTDMVLPGQYGGAKVAEKIRDLCPAARVLFISGYSDELPGREGDLPPGTAFLSKPFNALDLALKVRRVLDS